MARWCDVGEQQRKAWSGKGFGVKGCHKLVMHASCTDRLFRGWLLWPSKSLNLGDFSTIQWCKIFCYLSKTLFVVATMQKSTQFFILFCTCHVTIVGTWDVATIWKCLLKHIELFSVFETFPCYHHYKCCSMNIPFYILWP